MLHGGYMRIMETKMEATIVYDVGVIWGRWKMKWKLL